MNFPVAYPRRPCRSRVLAAALIAAITAAVLLLASCGGGVGTGGTGSFGSAGSYSLAPVSGFGSIILGGIEFDDAQATVLDDDGAGLAGGSAAVRLGMVAEVQGGDVVPGTFGPAAVASTIQVARLAVGPVASLDARADTLTVLGQTVQIDDSTVFDAAIKGGLGGLRTGDAVSVHALPNAGGNAVATRVELATSSEAWRLRGIVSAVDAQARRLAVGSATLDYSAALNVPSDLGAGTLVHVKLARPVSAGVLQVTSFLPATRVPSNVASITVEGLLAAPKNGNLFRVGGIDLDIRGATVLPASTVLLPGVQVLVQGRVDGGTLFAHAITVTSSNASERRTFHLAGGVADLDEAGQRFSVRGVTVDYSIARFVNGTAASLATQGVNVRVQGKLSADHTSLQASIVSFP